MDKKTKEELSKRFQDMLEEWEQNPERMQSGLSYEMTFARMMREFEQEVLQKSVGELPKDKNAKKK